MLAQANGALALMVELALLAGIGRGAFVLGRAGISGWVAAVLAVVAVAAVWGLWAAPASPRRLDMIWLMALKVGLFAAGTAGWAASGPAWVWPLFAGGAALSLALGIAVGS